MMSTARRMLSLAALAALAALPASAGDLTILSQMTNGKEPPKTSTIYITADKFRASIGDNEMIYDFSTGLSTAVDNSKKEYWQSTAEEREAQFAQMDAQMKKLGEQMANLPPALRKMAGAATGGGAVQVVKTSETRKIAGYTCTKYLITSGETMRMEQWITQELSIPERFFDALKAQWANNPMMKGAAQAVEEIRKVRGCPLGQTTVFKGPMGTGGTTTIEATQVSLTPIPASTFAIPAGYQKKDSPFKR